MPDVATLPVMVGLPGSGNTTYSERLREQHSPQALILSSDDIRWTMGSTYKVAAEKYVRGVIENFTRGCMLHGRDVIVDATNLTKRHRADLIWWAQEVGAKIECHYVRCSSKESARRSAKWIPQEDIDKLTGQLEEPTIDEGFDKMSFVDEMGRVLRTQKR